MFSICRHHVALAGMCVYALHGIRDVEPENEVSEVNMGLGSQQMHKVLLLVPKLLVAVLQQAMQLVEGVLWHSHQILVLLCGAPLRQTLAVLDEVDSSSQLSGSCCYLHSCVYAFQRCRTKKA